MKVLKPCRLSGEMQAPSSKSVLIRELVAYFFAKGNVLEAENPCHDVRACIECLNKIKAGDFNLNAGESATTYRILREFRWLYPELTITMADEARNRDVENEPYTVSGNEIHIDASMTTQTLSGLLMVLPCLKENYTIYVENLSTVNYIELTLQTLKRHGVYVKNENFEKFTTYPAEYKSIRTEIEGDFSNSAPFIIANILGADIKIHGLNILSKQPDKEIVNIINFDPNIINANVAPDLVPILALWACFRDKQTIITNIDKLRYKESDRVLSTLELNKIGADIVDDGNRLIISGKGTEFEFNGGKVSTYNDHRIAFLFAIASTRSSSDIIIDNEECVKKSYPDFWEVFDSLCV